MRKNNFRLGFTLIELMVVIGIIGVLASVILGMLRGAKSKAEDKAIASNLHGIINQAELFLAENNNSYLPQGGGVFDLGPCPTNADVPNEDTFFTKDKTTLNALTEAVLRGNGSACYNSSEVWSVAVGLKENPNTSWCVDNRGAARLVNALPMDAMNGTTFLCN